MTAPTPISQAAAIAADAASRKAPTYTSYFVDATGLLSRVRSTPIVNIQTSPEQVFPTGAVRRCASVSAHQTLVNVKRSDPLGLYQSLDSLPMGYATGAANPMDETGLQSFCRSGVTSTGMGSCVSCLCNKPRSAHSQNALYGKDSFVIACIQGELWGSCLEGKEQTSKSDLTMGTMIQQNIFLGSFFYERANFFNSTACMFRNEIVGFPAGFQVLRVGFSLGNFGLHHLASYFEEGSSKFCNFFIQCHNAGGKYQVTSPTVEFQGTDKNGVLSVSIADKSSSASILWAILIGFGAPPFWQKAKKYIHKIRRADLQMAKSKILIRAGDCYKTAYFDKLTKKNKDLLGSVEDFYSSLAPFVYMFRGLPRFGKWLKKSKEKDTEMVNAMFEKKIAGQKPNPTFFINGRTTEEAEGDPNLLALIAPYVDKKDPLGGSHFKVSEETVLVGGMNQGPDIVVDNKNQTIKLVVGPYDAPPSALEGEEDTADPPNCKLQLIEISEKGIFVRIVRTKEKIEKTDRAEKIFAKYFHDDQACASISLKASGIEILYQGEDADVRQKVRMRLNDSQLLLSSKENVSFASPSSIALKGEKIILESTQILVNGQSVMGT